MSWTPRVLAYHLILTTYGFWLPNDPRGSWSDFVRAWELQRFGPATKTNERRSLARDAHDWRARLAAKEALVREAVEFSGYQARAVARGFAEYIAKSNVILWACAILPCHVHLVVARHERLTIDKIALQLKAAATRQLIAEGRHPFASEAYRNGKLPTPWARKWWKCFLSDGEGIGRAIEYCEGNPVKEGREAQHWNMVTPFPGF